MQQNGAKLALAMVFFIFLIEISTAQQSAGPEQTQGAARKISIGTWGGRDVQMEVTEQGAALEFDCARGMIAEPLLLDGEGKFRAKGTFLMESAGPVRKDRPIRGVDVVYSGTVVGDTMRLEFMLAGEEGSPEKFTLVRGEQGNLKKCL